MKFWKKNFLIAVLLLFAVQSMSALTIEKLKEDPEKYNGSIVRLRGYVQFKASIPLTELLIYILEDKTGSILVFSAFPKEKDDRVSIRAEVIAYIGDENEDQREETIDKMSDYLTEKEILTGDSARRVAQVSLKLLNSIADAVTGTWFVIEQEKRGIFNL